MKRDYIGFFGALALFCLLLNMIGVVETVETLFFVTATGLGVTLVLSYIDLRRMSE